MFAVISISGCATTPEDALEQLELGGEAVSGEDWLEPAGVVLSAPEEVERVRLDAVLCSAARLHEAPAVRAAAVRGLGRLAVTGASSPEAAVAILAALDDRSPAVRLAAVEVALAVAPTEALPAWPRHLAPARPTAERIAGLRALEATAVDVESDAALRAAVVACRGDLEPGVAFHARRLLGEGARP